MKAQKFTRDVITRNIKTAAEEIRKSISEMTFPEDVSAAIQVAIRICHDLNITSKEEQRVVIKRVSRQIGFNLEKEFSNLQAQNDEYSKKVSMEC